MMLVESAQHRCNGHMAQSIFLCFTIAMCSIEPLDWSYLLVRLQAAEDKSTLIQDLALGSRLHEVAVSVRSCNYHVISTS